MKSPRHRHRQGAVQGQVRADRVHTHYEPHLTEAEYIALKMQALKTGRPRTNNQVTIRHFSWEKEENGNQNG